MSIPRRRRWRRDPRAAGDMLGRWRARSEGHEDALLDAVRGAWPSVAGDAVAARSLPVRRSRAGVVTVACSDGVWAQELSARAEDLTERLRDRLPGGLELAGLRFVPDEHALRAAPAASPRRPPGPPPPSAERIAEAERLVGDVADPRLRELLARAAAAAGASRQEGGPAPPGPSGGGPVRGG